MPEPEVSEVLLPNLEESDRQESINKDENPDIAESVIMMDLDLTLDLNL